MRFDDSLQTVLAADTGTAFGAQSAFRQLVDLIGRRRIPAEGTALARLRALGPRVPASVRAASARALALADPPAALVEVFVGDDPAVAAPVLRVARLTDGEWLALLPRIGPAGRALLRGRAGLSDAVRRGLAAFGATDFTIEHRRTAAEAPAAAPAPAEPASGDGSEVPPAQTSAIAELVRRIESFRQVKERRPAPDAAPTERFAFEADTDGVIDWTDAAGRSQLIGRSFLLDPDATEGSADATIDVAAAGELAGEWRAAAARAYAPDTGRFLGYAGVAARPPAAREPAIQPDALRRLLHELRTPTTAIAGFAELIETELLGPAPPPYRDRARAIGADVRRLIDAIEDLEVSARADAGALDLAPEPLRLAAAVSTAIGAAGGDDRLAVVAAGDPTVFADSSVLDRLLARLSALVGGSLADGARAPVSISADGDQVSVAWPWSAGAAADASLLGADVTLRLARTLARALGGTLASGAARLTLRLPAAFNGDGAGDDPLT